MPEWTWTWTCVSCSNVNMGGEHCARCNAHWAGRKPKGGGRSSSHGRKHGGKSSGSSSSAHPSSWRSSADPTGGAVDRRSKSQEPKKANDSKGESPFSDPDDRIEWVSKEINSQIEKGFIHVRILTPEEAAAHPLYQTPPNHRLDKTAAESFVKTQRAKLQQALANYKTQTELGNDLCEVEQMVGLYRRQVFAATPIPEQLTQ